ncbi:zinc finger MYM-type protein 1-like [Arachis ipaensis]|uniref:zinc finger MYM-type protein 1-like n=1 Tax=Arachis ipaensis TaxID=130454 RepID=UPI0007AF716E|nr:zinc finger MYM-type protein 1-like [Arachis ipaensis]
MEKYFKRTSSLEIGSQNNSSTSSNKRRFLEFEVESLIADPGKRPKISSYHPNDRDKVRCAYLQKGPCQPRNHDFPQTTCGSSFRRFNPNWFDDYGNWLEYSISKDAVFCLCCYLMKPETEGGDAFVTNGFSNWKTRERLQTHVGIHDSAHNQAWRKCEALMKPKQHIIRGQGYDGASNMQGEFNGLKTLILKENSYAFYVHCFAHQLQLALVTVAKKQVEIALLFNLLTNLCNVVGASCKQRDMLRDSQMTKTIEALQTLKRAGDTRWGSHYGTILRLISLFPSVVNVLEYVEEDGNNSEQRAEAFTNELSQALQRNDQDIVNAMALVKVSKQRLQTIRDNITVPKMDDIFVSQGRSRRKAQKISNLHHFQVEIFYQVVDRQLQELNNRFTEVNTELLLCIACLNPRHSFLAFDKEKLIQLAQFYPLEFSSTQLLALDSQLENFILDVHSDDQFSNLNGIGALSQKLVETRKNIVYPLVFLLLKLALVLLVATASVERTFSAMNIIKSRLRNRMGDEFLNDCLVTYIEREAFDLIEFYVNTLDLQMIEEEIRDLTLIEIQNILKGYNKILRHIPSMLFPNMDMCYQQQMSTGVNRLICDELR